MSDNHRQNVPGVAPAPVAAPRPFVQHQGPRPSKRATLKRSFRPRTPHHVKPATPRAATPVAPAAVAAVAPVASPGKTAKLYKGLRVGSRAQVWHGTADITAASKKGLKKEDLMMNARGHIVSRRQHAAGERAFERLKELGYAPVAGKPFVAFKKHGGPVAKRASVKKPATVKPAPAGPATRRRSRNARNSRHRDSRQRNTRNY